MKTVFIELINAVLQGPMWSPFSGMLATWSVFDKRQLLFRDPSHSGTPKYLLYNTQTLTLLPTGRTASTPLPDPAAGLIPSYSFSQVLNQSQSHG